MKLQSMIATALAVTIGSAILAQTPAEKTAPAATENARPTESNLREKLDVYVGQLEHGSVQQRREAVEALGRIGERAKGAEAAMPFLEKALKAEDFWPCERLWICLSCSVWASA
jgi:HEAT repeat protein